MLLNKGMNWPTMAHICVIFQNAKLSVLNFTNVDIDSLNSHLILMPTVANIQNKLSIFAMLLF